MQRDYNAMPSVEEAAVWKRVSKSGAEYLSGIVKVDGVEFKITLFANQNKEEGDKRPDYSFKQNNEVPRSY